MLHCVTKLGVVRHCLSTNIIYGFVDPSSPIACIVAQANILRPVAVAMAIVSSPLLTMRWLRRLNACFIEEAKVNPVTGKCVLI